MQDLLDPPAPAAPSAPPKLGAVPAPPSAPGKLSPPLPASAHWALRLGRTVRRLAEGLYHHDGLSAAPAMAFHFFLSLLPLLVVVGWVLGRFARTPGLEAFFEPIFASAPAAVVSISRHELERLATTDFTAAPFAVGGFFWLASSGVHGMMDAFERALDVPTRRPYWKKRIYSLGFVVFGLAAVAAISFAAVGWEAIATPNGLPAAQREEPTPGAHSAGPAQLAPPSPAAQGVFGVPEVTRFRARVDRALALASFFTLSVCGVALFYRVAVENPKRLRRRIWPGAVLAIALWLAISWGFGVYVGSLGQYTLYYGSLAAVAVLLVWFWLTSLALLVGAELNAQLEGSRV